VTARPGLPFVAGRTRAPEASMSEERTGLIAVAPRLIVQTAMTFLVFALAIFLPAGTTDWWAGWTFLGSFFGFSVALTLWLVKHDPGLLLERLSGLSSENREPWDRALLAVTAVVFFAWLVLMPLDAVRFGWSRVPGWLQAAGAILLLASFYLFFLTFRENSYLSPAVRIQTDRGQTVVSTGPYRHVRHPMYAAFVLLIIGTSLLLASWYGIAPGGLILIGLIARRAVLEERTLQNGLPGYRAYMDRVRYRLIPHVW
jgi:protein-S-isoprenylcysteine O-methyltransferase Ste14